MPRKTPGDARHWGEGRWFAGYVPCARVFKAPLRLWQEPHSMRRTRGGCNCAAYPLIRLSPAGISTASIPQLFSHIREVFAGFQSFSRQFLLDFNFFKMGFSTALLDFNLFFSVSRLAAGPSSALTFLPTSRCNVMSRLLRHPTSKLKTCLAGRTRFTEAKPWGDARQGVGKVSDRRLHS